MKGKAFEAKVRKQLRERSYYIIRLRDAPPIDGRMTKHTQNVSDMIAIKGDKHIYIETKVVNSKLKSVPLPRQLEEMSRFKHRNPNTDIYVVIRYETLGRKDMHKMAKYEDIMAHIESTGKKSINCNLPWLTSWEEFLENSGKKITDI